MKNELLSIGEMAKLKGVGIKALRYYEKIGVIPQVRRSASGIRDYGAEDIGWVENAVCMRNAGVPVERIAEYVKLFQAGDSTFVARRDLLSQVLEELKAQRAQLDETIARLSYKVGRYEAAVQTGVLSWKTEAGEDARD